MPKSATQRITIAVVSIIVTLLSYQFINFGSVGKSLPYALTFGIIAAVILAVIVMFSVSQNIYVKGTATLEASLLAVICFDTLTTWGSRNTIMSLTELFLFMLLTFGIIYQLSSISEELIIELDMLA